MTDTKLACCFSSAKQHEAFDSREYAEPEDKASAMAMITEAAVAYDKTSPASFSLAAFEGATMTPLVFREQLRRFASWHRICLPQNAMETISGTNFAEISATA